MPLELRPYQREAVDAIRAELDAVDSTLLVASVGAGKTIIQAAFIQEMIADYPEARFLCAVHTRELVAQNYAALLRAWPFAPAGVNSAALGRRDTHSQILFCSIASVYKHAERIGWVDCLIIDECHLISPKATTMYRLLIDALRLINPDLRIVGMTGTEYRLDTGMITEGDAPLFKSVAFRIGLGDLIPLNYLVPPISKHTSVTFDLSGVHTRGGEYIASEAEAAVNKDEITSAAVEEIIRFGLGENRKSWLAFCAGVDHAEAVRAEFVRQGVSCAMVEGNMPAGERARTLEAYKRGDIRCLTNVNVLSIGFDHPPTDLIALMRPTKSPALYVQQVGRGLRLAPGKENCRVLDFAGVVATLGPVDDVQIKRPGKGTGEAPIRLCPQCECINHAAAKVCIDCGFEFPESDKPKHAASADIAPILSTAEPVWHRVTGRTFRRHEKPGSPPSVRCDYRMGLSVQKEYFGPEHSGRFKSRSDRYWHVHGGLRPFPKTADEWLERVNELAVTTEIQTRPSRSNPRYIDVIDWRAGGANDNYEPAPKLARAVGGGRAAAGWSGSVDLDDEIPF